jgi:hypothetical protein
MILSSFTQNHFMRKAELLLSEMQALADQIAEKYIRKYKQSDNVASGNKFEIFLEISLTVLRSELATKGTDFLHKSITEGVDDRNKLMRGILKITEDVSQKVKDIMMNNSGKR